MRFGWLMVTGLVASLARPALAAPAVVGDYLETRSLNVYAGACHYEGEYVTGGREAVLVWNVREGSRDGVSLAGVRVVALVAGDRNLATREAQRRSVLYVDAGTPAQREAIVALLRERAGQVLGPIVAVKSAPVLFVSTADAIHVSVEGVAELQVKKAPGQLCCIQAYQKWYDPFTPVRASKIGYSVVSRFREALLSVSSSAGEMNNAFFGEFAY